MLTVVRSLAAVALLLVQVALMTPAALADIPGTWSIRERGATGEVSLTLRTDDAEHDFHDTSSFSIDAGALGLREALADTHTRDVTFTLSREAGSFECTGIAGRGNGVGAFAFTPSQRFLAAMRERGYPSLGAHDLLRAAALDLSLHFVDGLVSAGYARLSYDVLLVFRALGVDGDYVRALQAALQIPAGIDAEALIRLRALGIDAAYVRRVRAHGFAHPSIDDLVRLKAMKIVSLAGTRNAP